MVEVNMFYLSIKGAIIKSDISEAVEVIWNRI